MRSYFICIMLVLLSILWRSYLIYMNFYILVMSMYEVSGNVLWCQWNKVQIYYSWILYLYDDIGSLDLYAVLEWVLYVVHKVCRVIYGVWVSWYAMFLWMFTLVTLRWWLSMDGWMGHYSCIAPSITRGLLGSKGNKVKKA